MSTVRPFAERDIAAVADLHRRVFQTGPASGADGGPAYRAYFGEVFLGEHAAAGRVSSLVFEDDEGGIVGFLGAVPRRLVFDGQPIAAVVCTQFAVDPARRGPVGLRLLKQCFAGPQDLCFTDESGDGTRKIWEWCGGATALPYSIHWVRPLRPARAALAYLARGRRLLAAGAPVAGLADALLARLPRNPFRAAPPAGSREEVDAAGLVAQLPQLAAGRAVHPDYGDRTVKWSLERAGLQIGHGPLRMGLVRDEDGSVDGGFVYYAKSGGVGEVLQIAARPDAGERVVDHLLADASVRGCLALAGRLEPALAQTLSEKGCLLSRRGYWTLIQSRRPELLHAIQRGDAVLSRLDGEWPLRFR